LNAVGKLHSANDRLAMCDMSGAKLVAHERSRADGSTSIGDDLRGLDVSSFSTSAADVGASEDIPPQMPPPPQEFPASGCSSSNQPRLGTSTRLY